MQTKPVSFIDEFIEVIYDEAISFEKTPKCPDAFIWRETKYEIGGCLEEWRDFTRTGKMSRNMTPGHTTHAAIYGSWGVGRFHFVVMVQTGQVFEIYYDRAPQDASHRKGGWILMGERTDSPKK